MWFLVIGRSFHVVVVATPVVWSSVKQQQSADFVPELAWAVRASRVVTGFAGRMPVLVTVGSIGQFLGQFSKGLEVLGMFRKVPEASRSFYDVLL